jgi:hypothetical protein
MQSCSSRPFTAEGGRANKSTAMPCSWLFREFRTRPATRGVTVGGAHGHGRRCTG